MDWILKGLAWIAGGIGYLLRLVGVEPTTNNIVVTIGILIIILLGILLLSWESSRYRTPRKSAGPKPSYQPNETNGLVSYGPSYPFVYKLTSEDGTRGWFIKKEDGPHSWLSIGDLRYSALIMRPVMETEILAIESELAAEKDRFSLRGASWKLEKRLSFKVEVVAGSTPSFTALNYIIGSNEYGDRVLIENPTIPDKPTKLRTWIVYDISPMNEGEFNAAVGEILDGVKK